jgi:hypothetical protein
LSGADIVERIDPNFLVALQAFTSAGREVEVDREWAVLGRASGSLPARLAEPIEDRDFLAWKKDRKAQRQTLKNLAKSYETNGMPMSKAHVERALREYDQKGITADFLIQMRDRIEDDLRYSLILMRLPSDRAAFWEQRTPFGEAVFERFEHARIDATEAGNCYAAGRNTACVFHLMRVMEHALRALATSLEIPDPGSKPDRSWGAMLKAIADRIEAVAITKPKGWKQGEGAIFTGAHGLLVGVKDAWRNDTMHLEAKYDEGDAKRIYDAVNVFMAHLAKLPEKA